MTRQEKGPTCVSSLADESQSRLMGHQLWTLYTLNLELWAAALIHFESCLAYYYELRINVVIDENGAYNLTYFVRCLVPATRCKVGNGRLALR